MRQADVSCICFSAAHLLLSAGAAVSAAICSYIVARKIQAYADVLKKSSENLEARNTDETVSEKAIKQSPPHPSGEEVLVGPLYYCEIHERHCAHSDSAFHVSCQPLRMDLCFRAGLTGSQPACSCHTSALRIFHPPLMPASQPRPLSQHRRAHLFH